MRSREVCTDTGSGAGFGSGGFTCALVTGVILGGAGAATGCGCGVTVGCGCGATTGVMSTEVASSWGRTGEDAPEAVNSRSRRLEMNFAILGDSAEVSVGGS